ncbi:MAG: PfkB family carbohydrate kinase [Armatimonadota bacterium]|nr:PfkB family carbohydrate kinase [Armatimonadota bacterium]
MPSERQELHALIDALRGRRAAVVGDLMLDEYVFGTVSRISPEAPVPVVDVDVDQHAYAPGGATNVANNLRALGVEVALFGVVGDDPQGQILLGRLRQLGIDTSGVLVDRDRPTTVKTRIIAHSQQVVRVDREVRAPLSSQSAARLVEAATACVGHGVHALLISDYDKGVATAAVVAETVSRCRRAGLLVAANPKPANLEYFRGASVVTLNHLEAEAAAGERLGNEERLRAAGQKLCQHLQLEALVITRGSQGMLLVENGGRVTGIPAAPVEVYDVVGAGDTAFSVLALAWAAGAPVPMAATLANLAGAAVVRKVGTAVVTPEELHAMVDGV